MKGLFRYCSNCKGRLKPNERVLCDPCFMIQYRPTHSHSIVSHVSAASGITPYKSFTQEYPEYPDREEESRREKLKRMLEKIL